MFVLLAAPDIPACWACRSAGTARGPPDLNPTDHRGKLADRL